MFFDYNLHIIWILPNIWPDYRYFFQAFFLFHSHAMKISFAERLQKKHWLGVTRKWKMFQVESLSNIFCSGMTAHLFRTNAVPSGSLTVSIIRSTNYNSNYNFFYIKLSSFHYCSLKLSYCAACGYCFSFHACDFFDICSDPSWRREELYTQMGFFYSDNFGRSIYSS